MEWTHRLTVRLNILVLQPSFVSLVITVGELTLTSSPRFGSTGSYNSASFEGAEEPVYHPQYDNINMLRADQVDGLLAPEAQVIIHNNIVQFLVYLWTCFFKWRSLWNFSSVASINKILISNYLFLKMNGFKKFRRF